MSPFRETYFNDGNSYKKCTQNKISAFRPGITNYLNSLDILYRFSKLSISQYLFSRLYPVYHDQLLKCRSVLISSGNHTLNSSLKQLTKIQLYRSSGWYSVEPAIPCKTIGDISYILPKFAKTYIITKNPPCPPKSMLLMLED